ncbi:ATP-grasp domain-containing protein [Candidatus Dojkabacteria bacterium]|nr:ATP-grasp domain-containing protein [Candidatus Dojkabacteria bacterium]
MTDSNKLKIGVIFGGLSAEKEISLATGRYVYSLVDRSKYEAVPLYMARNANIYKIPDKLVIQNKTDDVESRLEEAERIKYDDLHKYVDVMFIALLGKYGEDGVIQGLLEMLNIPYTGAGVLSSSIGMHKRVTKQLLKGHGILVPEDVVLYRTDWQDDDKREKVVQEMITKLGLPFVVKPTREGSSVGVTFCKDESMIKECVDEAFKWDNEILAEKYIKGTEFMCVVIGNNNPAAMTPSEVDFEGDIHTYESKYMPGRAQYHTPPRISSEMVNKIKDTAVNVYKLMGVKGYGRVDGYVVDDKIYIGETHTGTIMVPSSYVFQQVSRSEISADSIKGASMKSGSLKSGANGSVKGGKVQTGLSPRELITTIVNLAIDAHSNKKGSLQ